MLCYLVDSTVPNLPSVTFPACAVSQTVWGQVCLRMGRTLYDKWGNKHASTVKRWKFRDKMNFTGDNVISLLSYNWQSIVCCYVVKGCWQSWYSWHTVFHCCLLHSWALPFQSYASSSKYLSWENLLSLFLCANGSSWNKQKGSDEAKETREDEVAETRGRKEAGKQGSKHGENKPPVLPAPRPDAWWQPEQRWTKTPSWSSALLQPGLMQVPFCSFPPSPTISHLDTGNQMGHAGAPCPDRRIQA